MRPMRWITASRATKSGSASRTSLTLRCRSGLAAVNLVPPSKSIPKFRVPSAIAAIPARSSTAEIANQSFQPPTKSTLENTGLATPRPDFLLGDTHHPGREVEAAVRDHAEKRPRDHYGREHAQDDAERQQDREASHRSAGECEEDKGGYQGRNVAVQDRGETFLVAGLYGGAGGLSAPGLLLYPLEDHDVRVRSDADREYDPRYPWQGHGDRNRHDQPPAQQRVDQQRQVRHHPQRSVDHHQENEDQPEAHERGDKPAPQRVRPEGGSDGRHREHPHVHREGTGLEHDLQLPGLLFREPGG